VEGEDETLARAGLLHPWLATANEIEEETMNHGNAFGAGSFDDVEMDALNNDDDDDEGGEGEERVATDLSSGVETAVYDALETRLKMKAKEAATLKWKAEIVETFGVESDEDDDDEDSRPETAGRLTVATAATIRRRVRNVDDAPRWVCMLLQLEHIPSFRSEMMRNIVLDTTILIPREFKDVAKRLRELVESNLIVHGSYVDLAACKEEILEIAYDAMEDEESEEEEEEEEGESEEEQVEDEIEVEDDDDDDDDDEISEKSGDENSESDVPEEEDLKDEDASEHASDVSEAGAVVESKSGVRTSARKQKQKEQSSAAASASAAVAGLTRRERACCEYILRKLVAANVNSGT
jgi:hypothetical protein